MFVLFHLAFSTPIFPFHIILFSHFESRCSQITSYHLPSLSTFVIVSTRQAVHFASMFIIFYILFHMLVCRFCSPLHPLRPPPPSPYLSPSAWSVHEPYKCSNIWFSVYFMKMFCVPREHFRFFLSVVMVRIMYAMCIKIHTLTHTHRKCHNDISRKLWCPSPVSPSPRSSHINTIRCHLNM